MLFEILISCALFVVAAQAGYGQYGYGGGAGYAAHLQPAVSVEVLHNNYGYGPAVSAYAGPYGHGYVSGVDGAALRYANLALSLPSAGYPNTAVINVPQYPVSQYSAPAVVVASGYGSSAGVVSQSAAAAASNVKSAGSGYGPVAVASAY